jgi:hypothetical protein
LVNPVGNRYPVTDSGPLPRFPKKIDPRRLLVFGILGTSLSFDWVIAYSAHVAVVPPT